MIKNVKKSFGFTLVELMVVISIIAILAAVGIPSYTGVLAKARDARRKQDLQQLKTALVLYYQDNNTLPDMYDCSTYGTPSGIPFPCTPVVNSSYQLFSTLVTPNNPSWITAVPPLTPKYIEKEPLDPFNTGGAYICRDQGTPSICGGGQPSNYVYQAVVNASSSPPYNEPCFTLAAQLENSNDPDLAINKNLNWCDGSPINKTTILGVLGGVAGSIYPIYPVNTYMIVVRL